MSTRTRTAGSPDPVDQTAFDDVLTGVADRRAEFRRLRYVPKDFVARLKEIGLYRASTPAKFGGRPLSPMQFLDRVERISTVDGSTGWVSSFGSGGVYLAGLPMETQAEIYADGPDITFAGGFFPVQPAAVTANGFVIDGRWKFASGCMGADILGVGIPDGESGGQRIALLRPEQVEIVQEWNVAGLQGTGSFDLVVRGVEVPRSWTFVRGGTPTVDEPLYRYPALAYFGQVLAVVGAGVARAALNYAKDIGAGYAGVTGAPRLADRPYYRTQIALAEASLRSARSWFYEITHDVWETVLAGDPVTDERTAYVRLAAAHLAKTASDVVGQLVEISGTAPIHSDHPLQLLLGDAMVPKQHASLGPATYDSAGAALMTSPPAGSMNHA